MQHPLWQKITPDVNDRSGELISRWQKTLLMEGIRAKDIARLTAQMHTRHYAPGEYIFRQDDEGIGAVLILSGQVSIRSGEQELALLGGGDLVGEVALVADEPRTADAVAVEPVELVFLLRPNLEEWVARHPKPGVRLMTNLAHLLARRLAQANALLSRTSNLSQSTVNQVSSPSEVSG